MQWVLCTLSHLLLDEQHDHAVFLRGEDGRTLSFLIGPAEAAAIERGLKGRTFARPLTHDLLLQVLETTGHDLVALRILRVEDGTYFAELVLRDTNGTERSIDCRPSDGLALVIRCPEADLLVASPLLT